MNVDATLDRIRFQPHTYPHLCSLARTPLPAQPPAPLNAEQRQVFQDAVRETLTMNLDGIGKRFEDMRKLTPAGFSADAFNANMTKNRYKGELQCRLCFCIWEPKLLVWYLGVGQWVKAVVEHELVVQFSSEI